MISYPDFGVSVQGFRIETNDGTEIIRASDGTPWAYHSYPVNQYTFTIVHPVMTTSEELQLRDFYAQNKGEYVRFEDPRTQRPYSVLMMGPPSYRRVRSGLHIGIQMKLTGTEL